MLVIVKVLIVQILSIVVKADRRIEVKNGNKYLFFDSIDKSKEVLERYKELWDGIKI